MSFWVTNETQYWTEFDAVMDEIERYPGLHVIPSIGYSHWWWTANEVFAGLNETLNDFILNASSVGRGLANKYFAQIVTRYTKRDCVLLWELGNELNLQVNLPPPKCGDPTAKCFGVAAMTKFTAEVVGIIKSIDPTSTRAGRSRLAFRKFLKHGSTHARLVPGICRAVTGSQTRAPPG